MAIKQFRARIAILVTVALAIGVGLWFWYRSSQRLEAWDAKTNLSLLTFNKTPQIQVSGTAPAESSDGPMGTSEYHYTIEADGDRGLYEVRTTEPAWVFWWDRNGEPQNDFHLDAPPSLPTQPGQMHPWATSNWTGLRATVARGAYPLRVMVVDPQTLAADNARIMAFLNDALDRRLSDDQVLQILEIAQAMGKTDPAIRENAWSHGLEMMLMMHRVVLEPQEVRSRFDAIGDPKIKQEWLRGVMQWYSAKVNRPN